MPKYESHSTRNPPSLELLEYCGTEREFEILSAWIEFGTSIAAGNELGLNDNTIRAAKRRVEARAAEKG